MIHLPFSIKPTEKLLSAQSGFFGINSVLALGNTSGFSVNGVTSSSTVLTLTPTFSQTLYHEGEVFLVLTEKLQLEVPVDGTWYVGFSLATKTLVVQKSPEGLLLVACIIHAQGRLLHFGELRCDVKTAPKPPDGNEVVGFDLEHTLDKITMKCGKFYFRGLEVVLRLGQGHFRQPLDAGVFSCLYQNVEWVLTSPSSNGGLVDGKLKYTKDGVLTEVPPGMLTCWAVIATNNIVSPVALLIGNEIFKTSEQALQAYFTFPVEAPLGDFKVLHKLVVSHEGIVATEDLRANMLKVSRFTHLINSYLGFWGRLKQYILELIAKIKVAISRIKEIL